MIARDKVVAETERSFTQGLVGRKEKFGSLEVFKENDGLRNLKLNVEEGREGEEQVEKVERSVD